MGICVRLSAGEDQEGAFPGGVSILISAASILFGKYLAAVMILGGMSIDLPPPDANDMKLFMAIGGASEYKTWEEVPAGKKAEVEGRWNAMPAEEQATILNMGGESQITAGDVFQASFSPYDILWFLLAAFTAYRLGSSTGTESDD